LELKTGSQKNSVNLLDAFLLIDCALLDSLEFLLKAEKQVSSGTTDPGTDHAPNLRDSGCSGGRTWRRLPRKPLEGPKETQTTYFVGVRHFYYEVKQEQNVEVNLLLAKQERSE
jgi:hypothetical protein